MKTVMLQLIILCGIGISSCENKKEQSALLDFTYSECKEDLKLALNSETIHFKMLSDDKLLVEHQNVYFNCEPGKISATCEIEENNITICESEEKLLADCICPYDLSFTVTGINTGENVISVFLMDYMKLQCTLNLNIETDTIVQISLNQL